MQRKLKTEVANLAPTEKDDSNSCSGIYALGSVSLLEFLFTVVHDQ